VFTRGSAVVSAVAVGALAVSTALAAGGSLAPLRWDQASKGLPVLTAEGRDVWVHSIAFNSVHSSVYRVDSRRGTVSPTPLKQQFLDLFPGEGALWASALSITEPTRLLLYWIDIAHGFHLQEKAVPATCEFGDGGHSAVWGGRLWLTCSRFGVYAFTPSSRRSVQALQIQDVQALLATSNGLWAATGAKVQRIAGAGKGAFVWLPNDFYLDGHYASNAGWAVAGSTVWAVGHGPVNSTQLVRLDLRNRKVTAFGIAVPGLSSTKPCCGVAIAGREVLLADSQHLRIVRYDASHPWKPIGFITLPGQRSDKSDVTLTAGAGVAWITVHDPKGFHLYRLTLAL
jgi:hypothetical protein